MIEQVFLTGLPIIRKGPLSSKKGRELDASIPHKLAERPGRAIAIDALPGQKKELPPLHHELFKLLGAHAGSALIAAELFARAGGKIPRLDSLEPSQGVAS